MNRIELASIYPGSTIAASTSFTASDMTAHMKPWDTNAFDAYENTFTGINQQTGEICEEMSSTLIGSVWPDGYYKIEARQYELSKYNVSTGSYVRTGRYIVRNTKNVYWNRSIISWMTYIAPGSFMMGSPVGELGRSSNETVHRVTLTQGFYLGRIPCTNKLFNVLTGVGVTDNRPKVYIKYARYNLDGKVRWSGEDYVANELPSGYIDYPHLYECLAPSIVIPNSDPLQQDTPNQQTTGGFIAAITSAYSPTSHGYKWELPTEAQWEYACRAGTSTAFNNGLNLDKRTQNETNNVDDDAVFQRNIDDICWYSKNKPADQLQVAGLKKPNAWGLYDMHGNVWEWCRDSLRGYTSSPVTDPVGAATSSNRCLRGGACYGTARLCRSAGYRNGYYPSDCASYVGFRLALVPSTP